jgi:hypothetical protein
MDRIYGAAEGKSKVLVPNRLLPFMRLMEGFAYIGWKN